MKHTGFGWRIVLAVYAAFTLGCAGLAVAFSRVGTLAHTAVALWHGGFLAYAGRGTGGDSCRRFSV